MGGAIAQEFAINHPQLVDRLAIVCSWAACDRYLERCFVIMKEMALTEGAKGPGWSNAVQRFLSLIGFARDFFYDVRDRRERGGRGGRVAAGHEQSYLGFVAQADACLSHDTRKRLARSPRQPSFLPATPTPSRRCRCRRPLPRRSRARLQIMTGRGHVMFYERPKDFNSRIIDFLAGDGA